MATSIVNTKTIEKMKQAEKKQYRPLKINETASNE